MSLDEAKKSFFPIWKIRNCRLATNMTQKYWCSKAWDRIFSSKGNKKFEWCCSYQERNMPLNLCLKKNWFNSTIWKLILSLNYFAELIRAWISISYPQGNWVRNFLAVSYIIVSKSLHVGQFKMCFVTKFYPVT